MADIILMGIAAIIFVVLAVILISAEESGWATLCFIVALVFSFIDYSWVKEEYDERNNPIEMHSVYAPPVQPTDTSKTLRLPQPTERFGGEEEERTVSHTFTHTKKVRRAVHQW